jgi:hypothetical protein
MNNKILQDKIDKIGAFRFTIKGWSLTLVVATILAGTSSKTLPVLVVLGLLCVFVIIFFFVEKKQTDLSGVYVKRVLQIESLISTALRKSANGTRLREFDRLLYAPGLAHYLRSQTMRNQEGGFLRRLWRKFLGSDFGRKIIPFLRADLWFYVSQLAAIVIVAVILRHAALNEDSAGRIQIIRNESFLDAPSPRKSDSVNDGDKNAKEEKAKKSVRSPKDPTPRPSSNN